MDIQVKFDDVTGNVVLSQVERRDGAVVANSAQLLALRFVLAHGSAGQKIRIDKYGQLFFYEV